MKNNGLKCPICGNEMITLPGHKLDPNDGVTVRCENERCPTYENVEGHGSNEKNAYEIACMKYKKGVLVRVELKTSKT